MGVLLPQRRQFEQQVCVVHLRQLPQGEENVIPAGVVLAVPDGAVEQHAVPAGAELGEVDVQPVGVPHPHEGAVPGHADAAGIGTHPGLLQT